MKQWFMRVTGLDELFRQMLRLEVVVRSEARAIRLLLNQRSDKMEQVTQDLVDAVKVLTDAVAPLPAAVDVLESKVTELTNKVPGMSQEDKDALTQALADVRAVSTAVSGAVKDAGDGVDEAAGAAGSTDPVPGA